MRAISRRTGSKRRNHDRFGRVVNDQVAAGHLLEGANVAAFAPDDAAFEFVGGQRHNRNRGFGGLIDGAALNRHRDDAARFFFGVLAASSSMRLTT